MVIGFFILSLLLMLMVVRDGWLPFTKGFRSARCTKFRFLSSLAYLLQS